MIVDAQEVIFDDTTQSVEATGNVSELPRNPGEGGLRPDRAARRAGGGAGARHHHRQRGRELREDTLTYDAREQVAELSPAEAIVNGVYIRSERMRSSPGLINAGESMLTTCDPADPPYRVTASRIDAIPGDRVVAYGATLWLGRYGIFTLPVFIVSLRSPKETAGSFPSVGYTADATLTLGDNVLRVYGASPLAVDAVDPRDLVDQLLLEYQKTDKHEDVVATTLRIGISDDYMTHTASANVVYGELVAKAYHWEAGTQYNLATRVVTLLADSCVALGTDTDFTV